MMSFVDRKRHARLHNIKHQKHHQDLTVVTHGRWALSFISIQSLFNFPMSQLKVLADQNQVNGWKRTFCKRIGKHLRDCAGNPTLLTNDKLFELSASVKSSVIGQ